MLLGRHLDDREARRTPEVDDDGRILKIGFGQRRHDACRTPVEGRRSKLEPRLFGARNRMKGHVVTDALWTRVQAHGRDHAAAHAARVRDDGIDGRGAVDLLHDGAHGQHGDREKHQVGVEHALGDRGRHAVGDPRSRASESVAGFVSTAVIESDPPGKRPSACACFQASAAEPPMSPSPMMVMRMGASVRGAVSGMRQAIIGHDTGLRHKA